MMVSERPRRLLAIDDDVSSAELIVRIAERCRYEAFATSDSRGVMNLASALRPDILSIDICMPNLDAYDLFELLSAASYGGRILIVSGQQPDVLESTRQRALALDLDAPHALQKPIDVALLRSLLTSRDILNAA